MVIKVQIMLISNVQWILLKLDTKIDHHNNSTNINKTKESLNSDDQQFYQYQQNKTKFKH